MELVYPKTLARSIVVASGERLRVRGGGAAEAYTHCAGLITEVKQEVCGFFLRGFRGLAHGGLGSRFVTRKRAALSR